MELNLDFTGIKSNKISEGEHRFLIEDIDVVPAKNGESNNIKLKVTVDEGSEDDGKSITHFVSLHENALWKAKLFFEAVTGEEVTTLSVDTDAFVGMHFNGYVESDPTGKFVNIVTYESVS